MSGPIVASELELIPASEHERWLAVLAEIPAHDFYHLPGYHEVAERSGAGEARLFVYREAGRVIALPLLIRRCAEVAGLEAASSRDATSVYGYAGPIASEVAPPEPVVPRFQVAIREALTSMGVVSLFTSLHPLLPQADLLGGLGRIVPGGRTVSIDLTLSEEEQVGQYRTNHLRDLRKLRALGATCGPETTGLGDFVPIYTQTMVRLGAAQGYYFDDRYFDYLASLLGSEVRLFTCVLDGQVIAAGLFLWCGQIVQYHLGATRTGFEHLGAVKLVIDTARRAASAEGMRVLHLGGGRGSQQDSLYHFKEGFSHRLHPYATWRWVLDEGAYADLLRDRVAWNARHGEAPPTSGFFPAYREPTKAT